MEFKQRVKQAFNQWKKNGAVDEAKKLNKGVGTEYFDSTNPHFFTGNTDSEIVLIHLNPKRNKEHWNKKCDFPDFESYWDTYVRFGKLHYGENSKRTHKSPFDHKQIRFLKPFGLLPIDNKDKFQNLENVIDCKLQIELVPFGSPDFIFQQIGIKNLSPFIENLQSLIIEKPRKYVIFCGRIFEHILKDYIRSKTTHSFKLTKKNGKPTKDDFHVINITLNIGDEIINACIAPQFAKQGYPVMEYGKKVKELYTKRN